MHPSRASSKQLDTGQVFVTLTQTFGSKIVNEIKPGFNYINSGDLGVVPSPTISLRGYTIGQEVFKPLFLTETTYSVRDDFTYIRGSHEIKAGGDYLHHANRLFWPSNKYGNLDATGGPVPANLEDLFPVWNDPTTWNLAALSPIARTWTQSVSNADYTIRDPQHVWAVWLQDNWQASPRLTLNAGVRWDVALNSLGENIDFPPFRTPQPHQFDEIAPRLGGAFKLDDRTVLRGGWGKDYQGLTNQPSHHSRIDLITVAPTVVNEGRPDFASNPFNGPTPSFDQALAMVSSGLRNTTGIVLNPDAVTPYAYQTSAGVQRQIGQDMSIQADYVWTATRHTETYISPNLAYDPATGANYPYYDFAKLPYQGWLVVLMRNMAGASNYHGLETAFTKRMRHGWQLSATYSYSGTWALDILPLLPGCRYPVSGAGGKCDVPITLAEDITTGDYHLTGAQRHRGRNGIWQLPDHIQLSGLYFFGDNGSDTSTAGVDVRQSRIPNPVEPSAPSTGRIPHRLEQHASRPDPPRRYASPATVPNRPANDGGRNLRNVQPVQPRELQRLRHEREQFSFGQPVQDTNLAYAPRMLQLGFRFAF